MCTCDQRMGKREKMALDEQAAPLQQQLSELDANPALKETAGGFLGIGAKPTDAAQRLQAQRDAVQTKYNDLTSRSANLGTKIGTETPSGS